MSIVHASISRLATLTAVLVLVCAGLGVAHASEGPPPGVVNINEANVDQLMLLPRIGEGKAQRIIEYRDKTPFKTVLELGRVKGIGLKTLRLLKPYVRIDGPTTLATSVSPGRADKSATLPDVDNE
jgi:competence protein ComEA